MTNARMRELAVDIQGRMDHPVPDIHEMAALYEAVRELTVAVLTEVPAGEPVVGIEEHRTWALNVMGKWLTQLPADHPDRRAATRAMEVLRYA